MVVVLADHEARLLRLAIVHGDLQLVLVLLLLVEVVHGNRRVEGNGIDAALHHVLHGKAHVVVLADLAAGLGLVEGHQRGVADLAADLLAVQVGRLGDSGSGHHEDGGIDVVVGIGEEESLFALGRDAHGRGNDVVFACGNAGEDAVPGDVLHADLEATGLGNLLDQGRVKADGILFRVEVLHGREGAVRGNGILVGFGLHGAEQEDGCCKGEKDSFEHGDSFKRQKLNRVK